VHTIENPGELVVAENFSKIPEGEGGVCFGDKNLRGYTILWFFVFLLASFLSLVKLIALIS
jgi:hypothetical protein